MASRGDKSKNNALNLKKYSTNKEWISLNCLTEKQRIQVNDLNQLIPVALFEQL